MNRSYVLPAAVLLAGLPPAAGGTDVPYGADGLPYLTANATVIVRAAETGATALPDAGSPRAAVYRVRVEQAFKGNREAGTVLRVVLAQPAGLAAKDLNGRLLFLAGPLTAEQAKWLGVTGGEAYQALGGRLGAVETPDRVTTSFVEEYLRTPADKRLAWAARALAVPNPFVRRSAVLEARAHLKGADKARAVEILDRAVRGAEIPPAVKLTAVTALEASGSDRAATILGDLAKNTDAPAALRRHAVEALARVPGGKALLTALKASPDPLLSARAGDVLNKMNGGPKGPLPAAPADLPGRLKSADLRVLQAAAAEARQYELTDALVGALAAATATGDTITKHLLVDTLGRAKTKAAADALAGLARDDKQPPRVRGAAILALADIDPGISKALLTDLKGLTDRDLSALAAALAGP